MSDVVDRQVTEARKEVRQVRDWLLRPSAETMEACAPALERAIGNVHELYATVQPMHSNPQLVQAIQALSSDIQSVRTLLGAAGELYCGRMRRLATPDGEPTAGPQPAQPISLMG